MCITILFYLKIYNMYLYHKKNIIIIIIIIYYYYFFTIK